MSVSREKRRGGLRWGRALAFCVLFACVFLAAQYVLLKKYEPADCWPQRFADYAAEPAGSIDMVFLGSSQSYWGTSPMILWNEVGIASVNMSGIMHHHTIVYEQLKALLEMNTPPKYVVFNPSSLLSTYKAGEEKLQPVYEQFIYTLPTLGQKISAFRAMLEEGEGTVDVASFLFPLLRYHSRWQELTAEDFLLPSYWAVSYTHLDVYKRQVQGFATTLLLGVITSMITAIVVTRFLLTRFVRVFHEPRLFVAVKPAADAAVEGEAK